MRCGCISWCANSADAQFGAVFTAAATVRNMVQAWLLLQMQPDAADYPLPTSFQRTVQQARCMTLNSQPH